MTEEQSTRLLQDIAGALVTEPQDSLKVAVINDNHEAGILKNLLLKAKRVDKSRIFQPDYNLGPALTIPKKCDIVIVPTFSLSQISISSPPWCVNVVLLRKCDSEITRNQLDIQAGSTFTLSLS